LTVRRCGVECAPLATTQSLQVRGKQIVDILCKANTIRASLQLILKREASKKLNVDIEVKESKIALLSETAKPESKTKKKLLTSSWLSVKFALRS
jgi:hypothetical protein